MTLVHSCRVTIDTMPLWIDIRVLEEDDEFGKAGDWKFSPRGIFSDRDDKSEKVIAKNSAYYRFKDGYIPTAKRLGNICRKLLIDLLVHELDEGIWVDGKRIFDPHKGSK